MTITDRIEIHPKVTMGKPVIKGTRIPIELILRKRSEGATKDDLLNAYPRLKAEDIHAAIGYAADTLAHDESCDFSVGRALRSSKHDVIAIAEVSPRALDDSPVRRYSSRRARSGDRLSHRDCHGSNRGHDELP